MNKKHTKKIANELTREDLIRQEVSFPKIKFSLSEKFSADKSKRIIFSEKSFNVSTKWQPLAFKQDKKGLILGCDFTMEGNGIQIELFIKIKLEFAKEITKTQLENTPFFPVLAIQIAFPFIAEIIAFNSNKLSLGNPPLVPDKSLLNVIVEELEKPKPPHIKNIASNN